MELPRYTEADFRISADTTQRRARAARWTPTPQLAPALTRPIRWKLIAQQYDQMIKYATAIRTRSTPQAARS